jgi:ABC-type dipeptide/oligopeptide/nickel transport system permease component
MMPGNFVETYASIISGAHHLPYADVLARLERVFGKPLPLPVEFANYMKQIFLSFPPNFGPSFQYYPLSAWTSPVTNGFEMGIKWATTIGPTIS